MYACTSRDLSREISWRAWHSFFIPYWEPLKAFIVYSTMKERWSRLFFPKLRVHIKDNNNPPHKKFHRFVFSFSSKFPDLNFAPYVTWHSEPGLPVFIPVRAPILVKLINPWTLLKILVERYCTCTARRPHTVENVKTHGLASSSEHVQRKLN